MAEQLFDVIHQHFSSTNLVRFTADHATHVALISLCAFSVLHLITPWLLHFVLRVSSIISQIGIIAARL